jgi:acetylornithine aminotransferase
LIGIELSKNNSAEVATLLQNSGVLVNAANPSTIRIAPALTVSKRELDKFIEVFKEVMSDVN